MRPIFALLTALVLLLGGCDPWASTPEDHFKLVGAHVGAQCEGCHTDERIGPVSSQCESCHLQDKPDPHYDGSCKDCHDPTSWSNFSHRFFPLENGHDLSCGDCHEQEPYEALDPTCESCHERPADHADGACDGCHTPTDWEGTIDHDSFFPTPHRGVSECIACHTTGDYSTFECIECHEHRESKMDDEHKGETNNYEWKSSACLKCHPKGKE